MTFSDDGCRTRGDDWVGDGIDHAVARGERSILRLPVLPDAGDLDGDRDEPAAARGRRSAGSRTQAERAPDRRTGPSNLIQVVEQAAIDGHPANFGYRGINTVGDSYQNIKNWRASASYVTGAHNMKVGYQGGYQARRTAASITGESPADLPLQQRRAEPVHLPASGFPDGQPDDDVGALRRRTPGRSAGCRCRARCATTGPGAGPRPRGTGPPRRRGSTPRRFSSSGRRAWTRISDISPRGGAAYDVFGNGKTAVKFNFGRYLAPATNDAPYTQNNPASRIVTSASRSWQDGNGNYVVDCDILNPGGAEHARRRHLRRAHRQRAELRQGRRQPDAGEPGHPAAGGASGGTTGSGASTSSRSWSRACRWTSTTTGAGSGISRSPTTRRVGPTDYEPWTIVAPADARLPGGGGYPITIYTQTAAAAARAAQNYVTFETDFGPARTNYWHGVDLTVQGASRHRPDPPGRHEHRPLDHRHLRDRGEHRQPGPARLPQRGAVPDDAPRPGVVHGAEDRRAGQRHRALAAAGADRWRNGATWNVPNTVVQSLLGRLPPGGLATGNTDGAAGGQRRQPAVCRQSPHADRHAVREDPAVTGASAPTSAWTCTTCSTATTRSATRATYSYTQPNGGTWQNPNSILPPRFARLNFTINY